MGDFAHYTLADWLVHIQRQHWRSIDLTLERVSQVWRNLCNLHGRLGGAVISIAGTNGKGSSVAMLEAVLREAGLKVGAYTSPYLMRYNERVRIDGRSVDDETLCAAFVAVESARADIPLTYFEFSTLCALSIFRREKVDVALLEVGMGGRLDAVNIIDNDLALITSIGIDHAQWLGATRELIAAEKAGVIKNNALAVCADPNPPPAIAQIAAERNCTLFQRGIDFDITESDDGIAWHGNHRAFNSRWRCVRNLHPPFNGAHQKDNLAGVIATLAALAATSKQSGVSANYAIAVAKARLAGRCQVIAHAPQIILDVAHNHDSACDLAAFLANGEGNADVSANVDARRRTHGVVGMLADKPAGDIFAPLMSVIDDWHLADIGGERGQTAAELKIKLQGKLSGHLSASATCHDSPIGAYRAAICAADAHDRIVVFGSFHVVGDIMRLAEHAESWAADFY